MTSHFLRRMLPIAAIGLIMTVVAVRPTTTADIRSAGAQRATPAVKTVPPGTRLAGDPGKKGDTYYWFESQAIRSTMRFGETMVVADRRGDGKLHAKVTDRSGNEHGDLVSSSSLVQYRAPSGDTLQVQNESDERATLDWAARQAYGLSKDGTANLVWDHGVMRAQRAARRDTDAEADEVETVWANSLVARLEKRNLPPQELAPGRTVSGRAWVTTLTKDGVVAGHSIWFEHDQVFAYQLAGLTDGVVWIAPERQQENNDERDDRDDDAQANRARERRCGLHLDLDRHARVGRDGPRLGGPALRLRQRGDDRAEPDDRAARPEP